MEDGRAGEFTFGVLVVAWDVVLVFVVIVVGSFCWIIEISVAYKYCYK